MTNIVLKVFTIVNFTWVPALDVGYNAFNGKGKRGGESYSTNLFDLQSWNFKTTMERILECPFPFSYRPANVPKV